MIKLLFILLVIYLVMNYRRKKDYLDVKVYEDKLIL
jgi:hypothetical protein